MYKRAEQVIELGWHAGSRHPDLADAYADSSAPAAGSRTSTGRSRSVTTRSTPPTGSTLRDGAAYGHVATSWQDDVSGCSPDRRGEVDADGNPIPARRHHPEQTAAHPPGTVRRRARPQWKLMRRRTSRTRRTAWSRRVRERSSPTRPVPRSHPDIVIGACPTGVATTGVASRSPGHLGLKLLRPRRCRAASDWPTAAPTSRLNAPRGRRL